MAEDRAVVAAEPDPLRRTGSDLLRVRNDDGVLRHVRSTWTLVVRDGVPTGIHGRLTDATEEVRSAAAFTRAARSLEQLADDTRDGVVRVGADARVRWANPAAGRLRGLEPAELSATGAVDVVHLDDLARVAHAAWRACAGVPSEVAHRLWHVVDGWVPVTTALRVVDGPDGEVELQATLSAGPAAAHPGDHVGRPGAAAHPGGVETRHLLGDRLRAAAARQRADGTVNALLLVDVDRFTDVTDALGHQTGDLLLDRVGARLRALVRPVDSVFRSGPGSFAVLVTGLLDGADALVLGERVADDLAGLPAGPGSGIAIGASVGVVVAATAAECTATRLVAGADLAVHEARRRGGGRVVLFDPALRRAAEARAADEALLRRALAEGWLEAHLQPVVDAADGRVRGAEALVRIRDRATGDLVPPDRFIPVAEETGLVDQLDRWMVTRAVELLAGTDLPAGEPSGTDPSGTDTDTDTDTGGTVHPVRADWSLSVNVSPRTLAVPGYAEHVRALLAATGVDPARLVVELTERVLLLADEPAGAVCRDLAACGVRLAVDDFGSGWSSLAYLRAFPLSVLKVDRSLVSTVATDRASLAIVSSVVELSHRLDLQVVAEGVETADQADRLRGMACDAVQGFLVSRPVPVAEFRALLGSDG